MSAPTQSEPDAEPGAPIPPGAIDPDLVKLARGRMRIGIITAAGVVFLCVAFLIRLSADRHFGGHAEPEATTVADVLADKVARDSYVALEAEPLVGNPIRATPAKGDTGLRMAPVRGTSDRLWLVLPGNGWQPGTTAAYTGRLRHLADLPFGDAVVGYLAEHPRPVFARSAAVRAAIASAASSVTTIDGTTIQPADRDRVAFEIVDPGAVSLIATLNDRLPTAAAWTAAFAAGGITVSSPTQPVGGQLRFEVTMPDALAAVTAKLDDPALKLWAARVEPVTRHFETTWGVLKGSSAAGFAGGSAPIPDAQIDLIGIYAARAIPADAYAVIVGDRPDQYSFIMPITIALAIVGALFAWALIRAIRRDLLPPRAA